MHLTPTRATRPVAALAALALLAGCSTTVTGSGRPAGPLGSGGSSASGSSSASGGGSGRFDAGGDPHEVWHDVIDASNSTDGSVIVGGTISGAGVGGAVIKGAYSTDDDGDPVAAIGIVTPKGGRLDITATGGSAWSKATAAVYEEYGYDDDASEQAAGKSVLLTDDDSGLDVYAALESFLDLCGPSDDDPASLEDGTYQGKAVLVVHDEKYDTTAYVDPSNGHIIASVYEDETVTFGYTDTRATAIAPDDADVVTVDGF